MNKSIFEQFCMKKFSQLLAIIVCISAVPLRAVNHPDDLHPVIKVGLCATVGYCLYKTIQWSRGKSVISEQHHASGAWKKYYADGSSRSRNYTRTQRSKNNGASVAVAGRNVAVATRGSSVSIGNGGIAVSASGNSTIAVANNNSSVSIGGLGWGWGNLFGSGGSSIISGYDSDSDSDSRSPSRSRQRSQTHHSNFHDAAAAGNAEQVESMLNWGQKIDAQDANGCTALYRSAEKGKKTVVESLLARRADANITNNQNQSPLFIAAQRGERTCVTALLQPPKTKGLVVWLQERTFWPYKITINEHNAHGVTPLLTASAGGHAAIVQDLLKAKGDFAHMDNKNRNAIRTAAESQHVPCVETLLNAKADLEDVKPFVTGQHRQNTTLRDLYTKRGGTFDEPDLNSSSSAPTGSRPQDDAKVDG